MTHKLLYNDKDGKPVYGSTHNLHENGVKAGELAVIVAREGVGKPSKGNVFASRKIRQEDLTDISLAISAAVEERNYLDYSMTNGTEPDGQLRILERLERRLEIALYTVRNKKVGIKW